ncbi:hypothetical protein OG401_37115 [Kitasatospora purpeofusca]|uniref:DUF6777 domain-containing protein n=1 Tax=Kitasatospora purpeofusca TaxID=67352 RepID=UPI00225817B0|nr:DUF6777 domain-containing protein [Kitasatospora purpeofusca]MCX4689848.1 hypothetical protein [Kitasatospora purpeofusca]
MAGTAALAVVAAVLIINNNSGGGSSNDTTVPTANEVALQGPQDPGPAPFTPSVQTEAVQAPAAAPATVTATRTAGATATASTGLHNVEGTSAGVYGGTMNKPSCDVERLISITSTGDTGRAWASAQGIEQSAVPGYLRSLTSAYLRVDTRVTNHSYQGGAAVAYQSVLQAGTAVLVDAQGVPRVRCGCGNPLKAPTLVSDAKYVGKPWTGFQPSTLVIVVAAPRPVTEIVLVDIVTGGWFARLTGQIKVVDKEVREPRGPLAPGVPPATSWPSASSSPSKSGSTSASTSGSPSGSTSGSTGPSSSSATASTSGATSSGATSSGATSSGATSSGATSSGATSSGATSSGATSSSASAGTSTSASTESASSKPTVTTTPAATTTTTKTAASTTTAQQPATATATCATAAPSTLPPCPTTTEATG